MQLQITKLSLNFFSITFEILDHCGKQDDPMPITIIFREDVRKSMITFSLLCFGFIYTAESILLSTAT